MPLEFEKSTFKEVNLDLDLVEKWLGEQGVDIKNTRFETIKKNVLEISIYREQEKIPEIIAQLGMEKVVASLIESAPFIDVYKAFKNLKGSQCIPERYLKSIVAGSFLSKDEDNATNQARNLLFQLELAALLKSKGIEILDFDDVSFELEKAIWNIQCKRPVSSKNLGVNIQGAIVQTKNFFEKTITNLDLRGIIAISIDKILETDRNTIVTPNGTSLENYVRMKSMQFVNQFKHEWRGIIDTRFLAVFVFFKGVADVRGGLSIVKYTMIDILTAESFVQATDNFRMKVLEKILTTHTQS